MPIPNQSSVYNLFDLLLSLGNHRIYFFVKVITSFCDEYSRQKYNC